MFSKRLKRLKQTEDYRNFLASPEIIEDSHKRCRERRIDAYLTQMPRAVNGLLVEELLESSRSLLNAARPIIKEDLYRNFTDEDQIIILCNHEGYAVDLMSSLKAIQLCFSMSLGLGTCFREELCGTNAIALAMYLKRMVVIRGDQHYCKFFKNWSYIASPIRSPNGKIIGYLDISMDHEEKIGHTLALVQSTVVCIEQKMHIEKLLGEMTPKKIASPETLSRFETLSRREREVFRLMAGGETIPKIAKTINVSLNTAKTYHEFTKSLR